MDYLPFDVTIAKEKRDKKLPDKLKKELPGIFNRVISGIKRLLEREDFTESELVNRTLEEYKIRSNTVLFWVKKRDGLPLFLLKIQNVKVRRFHM